MLSWSLNVFFAFMRLSFLISVKPLTTENTENKTTPKICKITVWVVLWKDRQASGTQSVLKLLVKRVLTTTKEPNGHCCEFVEKKTWQFWKIKLSLPHYWRLFEGEGTHESWTSWFASFLYLKLRWLKIFLQVGYIVVCRFFISRKIFSHVKRGQTIFVSALRKNQSCKLILNDLKRLSVLGRNTCKINLLIEKIQGFFSTIDSALYLNGAGANTS